jgi:hypothetical protein
LPGSGKTLRALQQVKAQADREQRQVYYCRIADLSTELGWVDLDAGVTLDDGTVAQGGKDWWKLPVGAIVLIDEAQKVFPPRGAGSTTPKHVAELEEHRHRGHDLFLISQHPMLVDGSVRRLSEMHLHVVRNYGLKKATIHEWRMVNDRPDKSRKGSIRHEWWYPKEVFKWYKSAEMHTHKVKIPARIFLIPVAAVVFVVAAYFGVKMLLNFGKDHTKPGQEALEKGLNAMPSGVSRAGAPGGDYLGDRTPRIAGLPFTAPVYDKVTQPIRAPFPAACVQSKSKGCQCWSEQGTRLDVPVGMCSQIVARGIYRDWDTRQEEKPHDVVAQPAADRVAVSGGSDGVAVVPDPGEWRGRQGYRMLDGAPAARSVLGNKS